MAVIFSSVWCRALDVTTTSRQCCRLPVDVRGGFQDGHPRLPVTVRHGSSLSGRRLLVGVRRRSLSAAFCQERVLWDEHTSTMETGVSQLQVRSLGTAFQLNCDKLT